MNGGILLTIADPKWRNQRTVQVANLAASWEVSAIGRLSAKLPAEQAHLLGIREFKGKWVRWDGGRQGLWGGVIKRNPTETGSGLMELSCDSFHVLLKGILTARTYRQASAPAGALWKRAIADISTSRRMLIDSFLADEDGPVLSLEWRADDLFDLTDQLASDTNHEWDVVLNADWTITAVFRRKVGRDRTGKVLFSDGYNVINGGQVSPSIDDLRNSILAVHEDEQWAQSDGVIAVDARSRDRYGESQAVRSYAAMTGPESLYIKAKQDLVALSRPAEPATLIVPASDPQLDFVRQGDSVRYWSARQNKQYDEFRVLSRSIDVAEGQVKLAGDCLEEAA